MQGIDPATGQPLVDAEGRELGPVLPPTQAIAGLTAEQIDAGDLIRTGIGGYEPFLQGALASTQAGQQAITAGALPGIQEALGVQRGSLQTLRDAQSLAAATRAEPFTFRDQALRGLSAAASDITGAQAGVPLQTQAAQQGIAAADVLGQRAAQDAQARLGLGARQARELAGDVGIGALGTSRALGRQLGAATKGQLQTAAQGQRDLLAARQGLAGVADQFDPSGIAQFMDPYTQQVVEATRREIMRTGELQKQQADAQAIAAGAFGGSRTGVQRGEIDRAVNEQIARQTAGLLSQGFGQALGAAQQAFEAGKGRQLQQAQTTGQLAQAGAGLGMSAQEQAARNAQALAQQAAQAQQLRGSIGLQAAGIGQQAAQTGAQLGLSAAEMAQRGAQVGGQLGLQGQQALAQMAAQRANIAQTGGQLGLQFGQLGQADVSQLAALAGQQAQTAQGIGSLAAQGGQLGGRLASMGQIQAALGQQAQQQRAADAQQLLGFGGMQQQQAQNVLNAQFAAEQAAYAQPLQQLGFLGDLTKALPSSQSSILQQNAPNPGLGQQVAGLALGAAALGRAF
tara:strand:+ start:1426 stop:3132 length:1707 start_codon:yes stop_codon:yes gene_type:complete